MYITQISLWNSSRKEQRNQSVFDLEQRLKLFIQYQKQRYGNLLGPKADIIKDMFKYIEGFVWCYLDDDRTMGALYFAKLMNKLMELIDLLN